MNLAEIGRSSWRKQAISDSELDSLLSLLKSPSPLDTDEANALKRFKVLSYLMFLPRFTDGQKSRLDEAFEPLFAPTADRRQTYPTEYAIKILAEHRTPRAAELIRRALDSPRPELRAIAQNALGRLSKGGG